MAIIDYGAIAFRNGKLISTKMFTPMQETCGFNDEDIPMPGMDHKFSRQYFVTVGNNTTLFGFYKNQMQWWTNEGTDDNGVTSYDTGREDFSPFPYHKWKYWAKYIGNIDVIVKPHNGYYVAKFEIDGDKYKIYFGNGVDLDWYKKTRMVNYYRTCPKFMWRRLKNWAFNILLSRW